jgi:hypothetical protein
MIKARRRLGIGLDLLFTMLPAALFVGFIDYTAWCAWWI